MCALLSETTSVGVEEIDQDHKLLLDLLRQLNAAIEAEESGRAKMLVDVIAQELTDHFKREEVLLERHRYPKYEQHVAGHTESLILLERLQAAPDLPDRSLLSEFIHHFLTGTFRADLDVKWFFLDRAIAPAE